MAVESNPKARYKPDVTCELCGGPLGIKNISGVCFITEACKTENRRRCKQRNKDTQDRGQHRRYTSERGRALAMVNAARARAKNRDLLFELEAEDILPLPTVCPVLGIPIVLDDYRSDNSPSLDRMIPEKGYVKDNVQVISQRANRIKSDATAAELDKLAAWVRSHQC